MHRGHPVNILIGCTAQLSSVNPANDIKESLFGHRNFLSHELDQTLGYRIPRLRGSGYWTASLAYEEWPGVWSSLIQTSVRRDFSCFFLFF